MNNNVDERVVQGFGDEWQRFDQSALSDAELQTMFDAYFRIFPWAALPKNAEGFDAGCGTGRWAARVAPRVGRLHCIDASEGALSVARRNLAAFSNCTFHHSSVSAMPLADASMDFGYSLGVLHHVPDTEAAIAACVAKLKPGAPFLLYLYYRFDNRPAWYRALWKTTELLRFAISRSPRILRHAAADILAATVYFPLARTARLLKSESFPLAFYRNRSFYVMRNDALDRFGTRLEQRFTRDEIAAMMTRSGLRDITFSDAAPFWCAVGWSGGL
ncbi:MAG TPA: class I SAM-dependent methyltransferase [Thermoanaerobaculia bacterium]|nr:class I SAM-dependent methyltransferase [Thermoanaerobaculia bacterium]